MPPAGSIELAVKAESAFGSSKSAQNACAPGTQNGAPVSPDGGESVDASAAFVASGEMYVAYWIVH